MRRRLVSVWDVAGRIVNVHGLSAAAERAGLTHKKILGSKAWGWNESATEQTLKAKHAECLQEQAAVEFESDSKIGNITENWQIHLEPVGPDPMVLCVATQVYPGVFVTLPQDARRLLHMMADDMDIPEIAKRLRVSQVAVRQRIETLRKRFGVHTNHGLVAAAGRHGLLT